MHRLVNRALAVAACAFALSACTEKGTPTPSGDPGQPTTTAEQTTTGAPTSEDPQGAPKVENPLNADPLLGDPCKALSASQRQAFGMEDKATRGEETPIVGPNCSWNGKAAGRVHYVVGFLTPNKNGLSDTYRGQEQGQWAYFEPTEVDGYPAVFEDTRDWRDRGVCNIVVGITDTLAFNARVEFAKDDACDMAKDLASAVIETLKNGG